jgi:hypothetical protein
MSQPGEMTAVLGLIAKDVPVDQETVDVAVMMDLTGSMSNEINAMGNKMVDVFDTLRAKHPMKRFRIGFVGYRDYDVSDKERFIVIDFTDNITDVKEIIRSLEAKGGDDGAEDVAGGFQHINGLSWNATAVRQVLFVADAPAHGMNYHDDTISDNYPDGDPSEINLDDQMALMASKQIGFTVFRMNSCNDKMNGVLRAAYQRGKQERGPGATSKATFIVADVAQQLAVAKAREMYSDDGFYGYERSGVEDIDDEIDRGDDCVNRSLSEAVIETSDSIMYTQLLSAVSSQLD